MGSGDRGSSPLCDGGDGVEDESIRELCEKHQLDLENLTLTAQPFKTLHLFTLATSLYLKRSIVYILSKGGPLVLLCTLVVACGFVLMAFDGPHTQHIEEVIRYLRFGLWWVALGVASSIGLGSGLHTFVLYLGPHIALFTIKATQCGRVDLKSAPYDTIQLKSAPSWLGKDCSKFGPPVFQSMPGSLVRVPLISILRQVQLEAVLWGFGTALGELPPYFISRAARISGSKFNAMEDNKPGLLNQIKIWLLSHSQYLNFFTVLVLASVPNPLFDLAGIMCGQFGIPFWEFFLATLIGKAIIKTHIQTTFIIAVCNNQLLQWLENELIWVLGLIPGLSSVMPTIIAKLHMVREKYLLSSAPAPSNTEAKQWNLSFTLIWNSIVWIVLLNFFVKIVTSTAQRFLKKQQESEMTNKLAQLNYISSSSHANSTPSST